MNINVKDTLLLNDKNEYVVASKGVINSINYYYLVDINNNSNIKFCEENNNELIEIENQEIIKNLISLFASEAENILGEISE